MAAHPLMLGDDGSEASRLAGELAAAIGSLFGAEATVLRAYPELPAVDEEERRSDARMADDELRRQQRLLEERARELEDQLGNRPKTRIAVGDAAEVIVSTADAPGKDGDRGEPAPGGKPYRGGQPRSRAGRMPEAGQRLHQGA